MIASMLGLGAGIAAATPATAAVVAHASTLAQLSAEGICDSTGMYGPRGQQVVKYSASAPSVSPADSGQVSIVTWTPFIGQTSIGAGDILLGGDRVDLLYETGIPGSATAASLTVQVAWSGPGLTPFTEDVTAPVTLSGNCTPSTSPPPPPLPPLPSSNCQPNLCVGLAATADGAGYWIARSDGAVITEGDAVSYGSRYGQHLNSPIKSIFSSSDGHGYWEMASDGGIFAYGDAPFLGSTGGMHLNQPVVGMATTPDGGGYWLVAADGGIFSFGDAGFYGSMGGSHLNKPIVGMAATTTGHGYYLVASDGGIFAFGDAAFEGSMGGSHLNQPVVGMATGLNGGYWEVASDGGIFSFGGAPFFGSTGGITLHEPIVAMTNTPDGLGYRFVATDGGVFCFGSALFEGSGVN